MKSIVYLFPNVSTKTEKFAIYAMQDCLEEVSLARILTVEQVEQLQEELLIDELLGRVGLEVGRFEKSQEKLVDDLKMRPRSLQIGLVLFGIELGAGGIRAWRQRTKRVGRKHAYDLLVDGLG